MIPRRHLGGMLGAALTALALFAVSTRTADADELSTIKSRGTLIVGVKADYPPFGFRAPSGEIEGIEPSLAADVAKRLGVKLDLVPVTAANRMQFLEQGKIDLMIATMSDTPERRRVVDIIQPDYYASGYNLMLPKSMNIASRALVLLCHKLVRRNVYLAARAAWKLSGDGAGDCRSQRCDRGCDVALRPDRERRGVGSFRVMQVFAGMAARIRRRGERRLARRSGSHRRRCRAPRDDGSRASRVPRNARGRVLVSSPGNRARSASAA